MLSHSREPCSSVPGDCFCFFAFSGDFSFPGFSPPANLFYICALFVFVMLDQSDNQNTPSDIFMTESVPSSPLSAESSIGGKKTRPLVDIPLMAEREHRSKFLNDPSTHEEKHMTMRYFASSQSGDRQTLTN